MATSAGGAATVATSDRNSSGDPHDRQNRLSGGDSVAHDEHRRKSTLTECLESLRIIAAPNAATYANRPNVYFLRVGSFAGST
jgi:hypothetical protein